MDRKRLTVRYDSEIHLRCGNGYISSTGVPHENLFIRPHSESGAWAALAGYTGSEFHPEDDEVALPLLGFERSVFIISRPLTRQEKKAVLHSNDDDGHAGANRRETTVSTAHDTVSTSNATVDMGATVMPEIAYGQTFSLVHRQSGHYVALVSTHPAEMDPNCFSVTLVPKEEGVSPSCEFVFVPRFKIHSEGDVLCRGDEMFIKLAGRPLFLHVTCAASSCHTQHTPSIAAILGAHSFDFTIALAAGDMNAEGQATAPSPYRYEVNGAEEEGTSFSLQRYDVGRDQANYQRAAGHIARRCISAGMPITIFHRERESFLTSSITRPTKGMLKATRGSAGPEPHVPNDVSLAAPPHLNRQHATSSRGLSFCGYSPAALGEEGSPLSLDRTRSGPSFLATASFFPTGSGGIGHSIAFPEQEEMAIVKAGAANIGKDRWVPFPLFSADMVETQSSEKSLEKLECRSTGLWIIEYSDPVVGGPIRVGAHAQYRIRQACSGMYLAVAGPGVEACFDDNLSDRMSVNEHEGTPHEKGPHQSRVCFGSSLSAARRASLSDSEVEVRDTLLCLIPEPKTWKDLKRTLFFIHHMFASDCGFLVEQECFHLQNVLTGMYACTKDDWAGADARMCLQWQPSMRDSFSAGHPPLELQRSVLAVHYQTAALRDFRDAFQALVDGRRKRAKGPSSPSTRTGGDAASSRGSSSKEEQPAAVATTEPACSSIHAEFDPAAVASAAAAAFEAVAQRLPDENEFESRLDAMAISAAVELGPTSEDAHTHMASQDSAQGADDDPGTAVETPPWEASAAPPPPDPRDPLVRVPCSVVRTEYASLEGVIASCEKALDYLIRFCCNSDEPDVFQCDGLPITQHQRVLFDLQLHRLVFDVIMAPFVDFRLNTMRNAQEMVVAVNNSSFLKMGSEILGGAAPQLRDGNDDAAEEQWGEGPPGVEGPWGSPPRLPCIPLTGGIVPLENITRSCHEELHYVCRLALRLLRQMVRKAPQFALDLGAYIPYFLLMDGYGLHVTDAMREVCADNPHVSFDAVALVTTHFTEALRRRQSGGYLSFLATMCTIDTQGIQKHQEHICQRLVVENGDLLMPLFSKNDVLYITPKKGAEPISQCEFLNSYHDRKAVHYFECQIELLGKLCFDSPAFCTQHVSRFVSYDDLDIALRTMVWTGKEGMGKPCRFDLLRASYIRLAMHCYVIPVVADPKVQLRVNTVLFGSSKLRLNSSIFSGIQDSKLITSVKTVCNNLLRANPHFVQADLARSYLMRTVCAAWMQLAKYRQYSAQEMKDLIPVFLSLLDGSEDIVGLGRAHPHHPHPLSSDHPSLYRPAAPTRLRHTEASVALMRAREMVCATLSLFLSNSVMRGADKIIHWLHVAFTGEGYSIFNRHEKDPAYRPGIKFRDSFSGEVLKLSQLKTTGRRRHVEVETFIENDSIVIPTEADEYSRLLPQVKTAGKLAVSMDDLRAVAHSYGSILNQAYARMDGSEADEYGHGHASVEVPVTDSGSSHVLDKLISFTRSTPTTRRPRTTTKRHRIVTPTVISPREVLEYLQHVCEVIAEAFFPERLVPLLADVTRYGRAELTVHAMNLLVRLCTIKRDVAQLVLQVHTLPSRDVSHGFDGLYTLAANIQSSLRAEDSRKAWDDAAKQALASLLECCGGGSYEEGDLSLPPGVGALNNFSSFAIARGEERVMAEVDVEYGPYGSDTGSTTTEVSDTATVENVGTRECGAEGPPSSSESDNSTSSSDSTSSRSRSKGASATSTGAGALTARATKGPPMSAGSSQMDSVDNSACTVAPVSSGTQPGKAWSQLAGVTRMLLHQTTVRERRRAAGLSESSKLPIRLIIRAEMMCHWRIHESLLYILSHIPLSSPTLPRLIKFFYYFAQSPSNAKVLASHIGLFLRLLRDTSKARVVCLHTTVAILGSIADPNPYITADFLRHCVQQIDREVITKLPDDDFVIQLNRNIFAKSTINNIVRRRMLEILRENNTLRHVCVPRGKTTSAEIDFTSALVTLLCNVSGTTASVLAMSQRMIPVNNIFNVLLRRGNEDKTLSYRSTARYRSRGSHVAVQETTDVSEGAGRVESGGFKLMSPYLRALVVLHLTVGEESQQEQIKWKTRWMADERWWDLVELFTCYFRNMAAMMREGADLVTSPGVRRMKRHRLFWFTSMPAALMMFFTDCYYVGAYMKYRKLIQRRMDALCAELKNFSQLLLELAPALRITVAEMVNYRRLLGIMRYRLWECGSNPELEVELLATKVHIREWLAEKQKEEGALGAKELDWAVPSKLLSTPGKANPQDVLVKMAKAAEAHYSGEDDDDDASSVDMLEEADLIDEVSPRLHLNSVKSVKSLLLPSSLTIAKDLSIIRDALRSCVRLESLVPMEDESRQHYLRYCRFDGSDHRNATTETLGVNAWKNTPATIVEEQLLAIPHNVDIRDFAKKMIHAMRTLALEPHTFVGLVNLLHNALLIAKQRDEAEATSSSDIGSSGGIGVGTHRYNMLHMLQTVLDELGLMRVVTQVGECCDDASTYAVTKLGVAMLHGGNRTVQNALLSYFETHDESFFHDIRSRLHSAMEWVRSRNVEHQAEVLEKGFKNDGIFTKHHSMRTHLSETFRSQELRNPYDLAPRLRGWPKNRGSIRLKLIISIFRLLQLMCEEHHAGMQNYIRAQRDNLHSANIVHDMAVFMTELTMFIVPANMEAVLCGFDFISELCQGPCHENQEALFNYDVCSIIVRALRATTLRTCKTKTIHGVPRGDVGKLKSAISTALLSLCEGCVERSIYERIIRQVPVQLIADEIGQVDAHVLYRIQHDEKFKDDMEVDALFNWVIFLRSLRPFSDNATVEKIDATLSRVKGLSSHLGNIEISRGNGLEKVYFRIPKISLSLTHASKDRLLWEVDRTNRSSKLADFMHKSDELIFEIEKAHSLEKILIHYTRFDLSYGDEAGCSARVLDQAKQLWNDHIASIFFNHQITYYENVALATTIAVNLLLIGFEGTRLRNLAVAAIERGVLSSLCCLQAVVCSVILLIDLLVYHPSSLYVQYKEKQRLLGKAKLNTSIQEVERGLSTREILRYSLRRYIFIFRVLSVILAVLSFLVSPYFAAFHLLLLIYKSATLRTFTAAITQNGSQLLLTAFFGLVVMYLFVITGFLAFPYAFDQVNQEAPENCETLLRCFLYVVTKGIRSSGGVADVMAPVGWGTPLAAPREAYDLLFYAIINIIFMNILFGIIIDTFGKLRDDKRLCEADMNTTCFICGLNSDVLEKETAGGFRHHVLEDHNMWMYLYFLHHLRRKSQNEYTGQESYVQKTIARNSLAFFPEGGFLALVGNSLHTARPGAGPQAHAGAGQGEGMRAMFVNASLGEEDVDEALAGSAQQAMQLHGRTGTGGPREVGDEKAAWDTLMKDMTSEAEKLRQLISELKLAARGGDCSADAKSSSGASGGVNMMPGSLTMSALQSRPGVDRSLAARIGSASTTGVTPLSSVFSSKLHSRETQLPHRDTSSRHLNVTLEGGGGGNEDDRASESSGRSAPCRLGSNDLPVAAAATHGYQPAHPSHGLSPEMLGQLREREQQIRHLKDSNASLKGDLAKRQSQVDLRNQTIQVLRDEVASLREKIADQAHTSALAGQSLQPPPKR